MKEYYVIIYKNDIAFRLYENGDIKYLIDNKWRTLHKNANIKDVYTGSQIVQIPDHIALLWEYYG